MVTHIAAHGYLAKWRHLPPNRYLELDGWRYWVMPGRGDDNVLIINPRTAARPAARPTL